MKKVDIRQAASPETRIPVQHGNSVTLNAGVASLTTGSKAPIGLEPLFPMDEALHRFSDDAATTLPETAQAPKTPSHARFMGRILGAGALAATVATLATSQTASNVYDSVRGSLGADTSKLAEQEAKRDAEIIIQTGEKLMQAKDMEAPFNHSESMPQLSGVNTTGQDLPK